MTWIAAGCGEGPPPNLLLVSIDTIRADRTSLHDPSLRTTPALARLAREGVRFETAYSPTATTGPSHATLFTGVYPLEHGVLKNGNPLPEEEVTLAEQLRRAGYRTEAVVSSFPMSARFGFDQGFERYDDRFDADTSTIRTDRWLDERVPEGFDRRAQETSERARERLRALADRPGPFFLFVHYFDPHDPYVPPETFRAQHPPESRSRLARAEALYEAEVAYTDHQIGWLVQELDALGLAERTLVVVTGDHGEGLMDHGHMFHGVHLYEEQVRVPLILRWPGHLEAGRSVSIPVGLVDLGATVLDLLGLDGDSVPGTSLEPHLHEEAEPRAVFLQRRHYEPGRVDGIRVDGSSFGIRSGRWKYIEAPAEGRRELYDLAADPEERRNLRETHPERAARLRERLAAWRAERDGGHAPADIPEADRERLEALGYVE